MMLFRLLTLAAGVLFGAGLTISGMTNPARVRRFLDLFGDWDPTLAFVMGSALLVMAVAWRIQKRMAKPAFAGSFAVPERKDLTSPLVIGSALFGVGWGIAGLCPGPAIAALALVPQSAIVFIAAMAVGMAAAKPLQDRKA